MKCLTFVKLTSFFSKFCQNAKKIQLCSLQMLFVKFLDIFGKRTRGFLLGSQLFLFFQRSQYWLAHQQFFWNIGHSPNRSTSLDPQLQNINNCTPTGFTFSVYIHGSWTLGKPYGTKPRCYWEHLGERILEHFENLMGTHWEQVNLFLKSLSPRPLGKKKTGPPMSACWAFPSAAWNWLFLTIFHLGWWQGQNVGDREWQLVFYCSTCPVTI
jgi:hypothetical protein